MFGTSGIFQNVWNSFSQNFSKEKITITKVSIVYKISQFVFVLIYYIQQLERTVLEKVEKFNATQYGGLYSILETLIVNLEKPLYCYEQPL